jgi:integrase
MCRQLAAQRADHDNDLAFEQALDYMWVTKTDAAARDVYFGFSTRVEMLLERYFDSDEYTRYEPSGTAISRRVKKSASLADELQPDQVHPHGLRSTAATYHAGRGLRLMPLMQMFGWVQPSTAERYISRNSMNTARQLNAIHSK